MFPKSVAARVRAVSLSIMFILLAGCAAPAASPTAAPSPQPPTVTAIAAIPTVEPATLPAMAATATPAPTQPVVAVGTDITQHLPAGDAASGQAVVQAQGCTACHISQGGAATIGPNWQPDASNNTEGIGTRAAQRITAADYKGQAKSGDQYIFESIVSPDAYMVPGNPSYVANGQSIMPHTFSTTLSAQNVADVIAYLDTIK